MLYNGVLVRFSGEFGIKSSQTKELLEKLLKSNIKNAINLAGKNDLLKRLEIIEREGRYYLMPKNSKDSDIDDLVSITGKTFGISSVSPCFQVSIKDKTSLSTIPAKLMIAHNIFPSIITIKIIGSSSGIDERKWKEDINSLCEKFSKEKTVSQKRFEAAKKWDLSPWAYNPEKKLEIEVFKNNAYITVEKIKSPGGFPLGLEDPFVALISGGIDSPVAAWMAMKRGAPLVMAIMDTNNPVQKKKALMEAKILSEYMQGYSKKIRIFLVPYSQALKELSKIGEKEGITCLLCKRLMYRIAESIAYMTGAKGIITGEILGEQASQTAQNLMALSAAATMPIFRPLFGFDKMEVIDKSKQIGTDIVFGIKQEACTAVPKNPQIRGELRVIEEAEKNANISKLVSECMSSMKELEIKDIK